MPKLAAEQAHADAALAQLHTHKGLTHLRVRKHGSSLIIESGPVDDPVKHARLVRDGASLWVLDIADHRGHWGDSGVRTTRDAATNALITQFGWVLTDIAGEPWNPERTTDPKY